MSVLCLFVKRPTSQETSACFLESLKIAFKVDRFDIFCVPGNSKQANCVRDKELMGKSLIGSNRQRVPSRGFGQSGSLQQPNLTPARNVGVEGGYRRSWDAIFQCLPLKNHPEHNNQTYTEWPIDCFFVFSEQLACISPEQICKA